MEKEERAKMIKEIKSIPIVDILNKILNLKKSGFNYVDLCPFHNDKTLGSFVVSPSINKFHCYACGEGGDAIDFIKKYYNIKLDSAIEKIYNIMDKDYVNSFSETLETFEKEDNRASDNILNVCYEEFSKLYKFSKGVTLNIDDYNKLKERKLTNYEPYFSFPNPTKKNINKLIQSIKEKGLSESDLEGVPGFFYDKIKERWSFLAEDGIGIKIRNENGLTVGISIRTNNIYKKYIWFSSSFAIEDNLDHSKGTSALAVYDVIYSEFLDKPKRLFITEGHFKAVALSKIENSIIIAVSGVNNISKIPNLIKSLISKYDIEKCNIVYDADLVTNDAVLMSTSKLAELTNKLLPTYIINWDIKYGKGIDDLFNNTINPLIYIKILDFNNFMHNIIPQYFLQLIKENYNNKYDLVISVYNEKLLNQKFRDSFKRKQNYLKKTYMRCKQTQ